jgi:hypothetical protein
VSSESVRSTRRKAATAARSALSWMRSWKSSGGAGVEAYVLGLGVEHDLGISEVGGVIGILDA